MPLHAAHPVLKPQEATNFGSVLRRPDFRRLWAAQAASQLADKFVMFTLVIYVFQLTGLASAASVLMVAYTVPSVVLSAPAGVYADRHDKRTLMLLCNLIRGGLILLIPLASAVPQLHHDMWHLILITLLFSATGQIFAPAEAASIPSLVTLDQIQSATSLFMTTVIVTVVLGIPMATLSIALATAVLGHQAGSSAPFVAAAVLFLLAGMSVWRVRTPLRAVKRAAETPAGMIQELREGLAILAGNEALRLALAELTLSLTVVFTIFVLGPDYMTKALRVKASVAGNEAYIMLIPATLGMIAAAAVISRPNPGRSRARLLIGALAASALAVTGIGVVPLLLPHASSVPLLVASAVALAAIFGAALGCILIPAFSLMQERTTEASRGRIFGSIFTVINGAVAIPLIVAGGLADLFGVDGVIIGVGGLLGLFALAGATVGRKRLAVLDAAPDAGGSLD